MTDPYASIPQHWIVGDQRANALRSIVIFEKWLTRWQMRIGPRARLRRYKPGRCCMCMAPAREFSIGEWFCDEHLPSRRVPG